MSQEISFPATGDKSAGFRLHLEDSASRSTLALLMRRRDLCREIKVLREHLRELVSQEAAIGAQLLLREKGCEP
jgi:hypothetical protein